jgi:hypothetical protein
MQGAFLLKKSLDLIVEAFHIFRTKRLIVPVNVHCFTGVLFDELTSRLDFIAH